MTLRIILYISIVLLITACAQVVRPSGGAKDVRPPRAIHYVPDSAALNFKSKSVEIEFDEYIQLKELNNQLVVSPPLKHKPSVKVKNKTLIIQITDTLKSDATYVFNFGTAIIDITENNPATDFQYIFSTGNYIDSLSLKGNIKNAFDHKTEEGVLVMLYDNPSDSVVYKNLPNYFAKTKKDGNFSINNVHEGKYRTFALKDANKNFKYDAGDQVIAFADTMIYLRKDATINLELFEERLDKQFIKKATLLKPGKLFLQFNLPVDRLNFSPLNGVGKKSWELIEYSAEKDSVYYWFTDISSDSLFMEVSDNGKVIDTLRLKIAKQGDAKKLKKGKAPEKFEFAYSSNVRANFDLKTPIKISFAHPIKDFDIKRIKLINDQDTLAVKGKFTDAVSRNFLIENELIEDSSYRLYIPPKTFIDIFDFSNDSIQQVFKIKAAKDYGNVKLKVTTADKDQNFVLQLLGKNGVLVREERFKGAVLLYLEAIHPNEYQMKLIIDSNANGKWDAGSYVKKIQPEKVIYYTGKINVRANWDMDLEWKVN